MVKHVVIACALALAHVAHAEDTVGMCYRTTDHSECSADDNVEKLADYLKSQCNFWSESKTRCREVLRCTARGWFVIAHGKHGAGGQRVNARCGAGANARDAAVELVTQQCGQDCHVRTWWIGPPADEGDGKDEDAQLRDRNEEQARLEKERIEKERVEKERVEKERIEKERIEKERVEKERVEKERVEKERIAREENARRAEFDRQQRARKEAEKKRQQGGSGGTGGSGALTPEQLREQQRQRDIAKGFQLQREAQESNRKLGDSSASVAGAVFAVQGGNQATAGTTRALRVTFGFGGRFLPVMTNTTGSNVVEESTTDTGGGFAFDGGLEFWPRYRQRMGIGLSAEGGVAGMAMPGGGIYAVRGGVGLKGYFGNRARWSIIGELGRFGQIVGSSGNYLGALVSGSGSYGVWRLGLGPSWCVTPSRAVGGHCDTNLYAQLLLDWTSAGSGGGGGGGMTGEGGRGAAKILRAGASSKNSPYGLGLELELGMGYPAPGESRFPVQPGDEDRSGTYFAFRLHKQWTWHFGKATRPAPSPQQVSTYAAAPTRTQIQPSSLLWAASTGSASSQYGPSGWSAAQALGAPNVYPRHGDVDRAWASARPDAGDEYIEVRFSAGRGSSGIHVYETFNPGAIRLVQVTFRSGELRTITDRTEIKATSGSQISVFPVSCSDSAITSVRVVIESARVGGWNEIDAIGLAPCQ